MSFEDALKRLEGIVRELESGEVPLDRAIALYEEGESLRKHCEARLSAAETRIRELQLGADGMPAGSRPFAA
jgi:exodeoxyribonuclease VII small subunit